MSGFPIAAKSYSGRRRESSSAVTRREVCGRCGGTVKGGRLAGRSLPRRNSSLAGKAPGADRRHPKLLPRLRSFNRHDLFNKAGIREELRAFLPVFGARAPLSTDTSGA